jgi:DNA primase
VIDWVMKAEGVSFRHAVELLREGLSPAVSVDQPPPRVSTVRRLESPVSAEASERELLGQVAAYYHGVLRESADARAYLAERGVGDEEAIAHFELGFADRTLGLRLEARTRKAGAELRGRLERLGVYRESGHEHLTGCVVFPIRDAGGAVVNLYGRRIGDVRRGAPSHLYLPGPRRGLWNREAFGSEELVLCESLIDALTFWCAGFRHVTTAWGVNGFTGEHGEAIASGGVKRAALGAGGAGGAVGVRGARGARAPARAGSLGSDRRGLRPLRRGG